MIVQCFAVRAEFLGSLVPTGGIIPVEYDV